MPPAEITQASTSRFAQTSKWRLHYNELGSGYPVILLHGSGPGATGWSNYSKNLDLAQKYRILLLDFPGWGASDTLDPKAPRNSSLAEAIKLLLDERGIERVALVGNSMGGAAAIQFAAEYPERISHLVTMGSGVYGPGILTPGGVTEGLRILRETYADPSPANFRRLVNIMVYDPAFATDALLTERSRAALANPQHLENFLIAGRNPFTPPDARFVEKIMGLTIPALFIHGRDDRVVHMETSLRAVSLVPDSRLVLINRCGHWAQLEHAAEFNGLVDAFLSLQLPSADKTY